MEGVPNSLLNKAYTDSVVNESFIGDYRRDISNPCKRMARSLYFSSGCRCIYLFLLIYNLGLGVWAIVDLVRNKKPHYSYYICECGINTVLICDVTLRLWLKGCYQYWRACTNVFEFIIVWVCMIITILSIIGTFSTVTTIIIALEAFNKNFDEVICAILMICLCALQYVRIVFIYTKQHQTGVRSVLRVGRNG